MLPGRIEAMETTTLHVAFAEHVAAPSIDAMASFLQACGNVRRRDTGRRFTVEVHRRSEPPRLKIQLTTWESYGFLRWAEGDCAAT
jgi:hypothetical protein